jgi:hypothetical protein
MPGYNLRARGNDDTAKVAAAHVAKKKRERVVPTETCSSADEYVGKLAAIDASNASDRVKASKKKELEQSYAAYLIRKQELEDADLSSGDEAEFQRVAGTLESVKTYVDKLLSDKGVIEDKSTAALCMKAAGLSTLPVPLDFTNLAVSLNPFLWPIVLERATPDDLKEDFSERTSGGKLRRCFERDTVEALTQRQHGAVKSAPSGQEIDGVRSIGAILAQVACHWMTGQEASASAFLLRWSPLLDEARKIVTDTVIPSMLERFVGVTEAQDFGARSMLDSNRLPIYVVPAVEQILRRPRVVSNAKPNGAVSVPDGAEGAFGPNVSKRLQRTLQKSITFDTTKHTADKVGEVEVIRDKDTKRILGRKNLI